VSTLAPDGGGDGSGSPSSGVSLRSIFTTDPSGATISVRSSTISSSPESRSSLSATGGAAGDGASGDGRVSGCG
jgi:hypothetical protein